ncbi:MAG TPA: hypothetical protein PLB97_05510 [Accumulibacter sp.]|jgi:hypothetical protein|nr:hypothetical protein [Accumulibacter sp.]HPP46193.1 hypothetical protein [Accumulibacter sp.]
MKTELTREQIMLSVEHARQQRSLAAGEFWAINIRQGMSWLGHTIDNILHVMLMSPTTVQRKPQKVYASAKISDHFVLS